MKWSWKIGTLAGIELRIHVTFLLLLGWVGARLLLATVKEFSSGGFEEKLSATRAGRRL